MFCCICLIFNTNLSKSFWISHNFWKKPLQTFSLSPWLFIFQCKFKICTKLEGWVRLTSKNQCWFSNIYLKTWNISYDTICCICMLSAWMLAPDCLLVSQEFQHHPLLTHNTLPPSPLFSPSLLIKFHLSSFCTFIGYIKYSYIFSDQNICAFWLIAILVSSDWKSCINCYKLKMTNFNRFCISW